MNYINIHFITVFRITAITGYNIWLHMDEQVNAIANCYLQAQLSACICLHQDIME